MMYMLTAETAHQVQTPLITNSSMVVNQVTKPTPKIVIPSMALSSHLALEVVRKNAKTARIVYPTKPMAGTGMPNG